MDTLIEVRAGRQTSRSVVQGPYPSALEAAEQLAGKEALEVAGVTETEVLTEAGLRSSICNRKRGRISAQHTTTYF
jgi:hypothetical protein